MQTFTSIPQFAAVIAGMVASMPKVQHHAVEEGCKIIEAEAKRVIGTYEYRWPQLAASTQSQRVYYGFPANEPGLRTGEMRDSIEHVVKSDLATRRVEGHVGSNSDKLVWFELGTRTQPPRSVLVAATMRKGREIEHLFGRVFHAHLTSGGVSAGGRAFNEVGFIAY